MATPTLKTSSSDATAGTAWSIPSLSYSADRLILVAVTLVRGAGLAADTAAITGLAATWTQVATVAFGASGRFEMVVYRTVLSAGQTGAISISATNSHEAAFWQVIEYDDAATVVQSASLGASSVTTVTATLAAFSDVANGAVSFGFEASTATITPGAGWSELGEYTAARTIQAQWRASNDTTADISWTGAQAACIIAMEIAAEVVTPPVVVPPVTGWGGLTLLVEVAFAAQAEGAGVWDSGLWDTATWGPELTWTNITPYVLGPITTKRGFSADGESWEAGSASITLDNRDGRFSVANVHGPYRVNGVTQLRRWRPVRITATASYGNFDIFRGYAIEWSEEADQFSPTVDLRLTDEFGILARLDGLAQASQGGGELAGARIRRILASAASTASVDIDLGATTLQATTLAANVVGELKLTAASDGGSVWVGGNGAVIFGDQQSLITTDRSREVQATFGDGGYLNLTGASTSYASTPDKTALDIVGDISVFAEIAPDSWAPATEGAIVAKSDGGGGGQNSWRFRLMPSGRLRFGWSTDGTSGVYIESDPIVLDPGQRRFVGFFYDVNNGLGGSTMKFFTSTDGDTWTLLSNQNYGPGPTSIFASTSPLTVGALSTGATPFAGKIWQVQVFEGDRVSCVASPVFGAYPLATSFTDAQDNVWTVNSPASIVRDPAEIHAAEYSPESGQLKTPNIVSFARVGGTAQTVSDITLRAIDGDSRMTRTDLICETDSQALALANQALLTKKATKTGFESISLAPVANAATDMPVALELRIRDRVRIVRRPPGAFASTQECFIRGVEHTITPTDWRTRFTLSPAESWSGFNRWDYGRWDEAKWFI